jgi:hypothetical protein
LRLDVSVANTKGMDVGERPEDLIHVQLDIEHGHRLLKLCVIARGAIDRLWDEFEQQIQKDLVLLVAVGIEIVLERNHVGVVYQTHYLQLSILKALVLQHLFDGDRRVAAFQQFRLEHDAKRSIADNFVTSVRNRNFLGVARRIRGHSDDGVWLGLVCKNSALETRDRGVEKGLTRQLHAVYHIRLLDGLNGRLLLRRRGHNVV